LFAERLVIPIFLVSSVPLNMSDMNSVAIYIVFSVADGSKLPKPMPYTEQMDDGVET